MKQKRAEGFNTVLVGSNSRSNISGGANVKGLPDLLLMYHVPCGVAGSGVRSRAVVNRTAPAGTAGME